MDKISIQFIGATGTVTGSKHLLKTPDGNILVDCGLYQGIKELRNKNREDFAFEVKNIKYLLLTHAHLDHCGAIPLLIKKGFKGKILTTAPSKELAEIILVDSAKIQEEDAFNANRKGYSKHNPALPLYTQDDVRACLPFFETCEENKWIDLSEKIQFRFLRNGHILGSCFIEMKCYDKKIVFSGDIGRYQFSHYEYSLTDYRS
jgi:metallo-beta-lactamase family protein